MAAPLEQVVIKPRKKPLQPRSQATVDAILAASAHILENRGFGGFNTNAVAEKAGVSIGSLYQYFPSKDAVLVAVIERGMGIFARRMSDAIDSSPGYSLGGDLRLVLRHGILSHAKRPALVRLLESEMHRLDPHINHAVVHDAARQAIVRLLLRHRDAIRVDDPVIAAEEVGIIAKALLESVAARGERDWEAAIERTARAILGYLGAVDLAAEPASVAAE